MIPRTRFLPMLAAVLWASACSDATQPAAPDIPLDIPEPQFWAGDGGAEVNTSIEVTPIQCSEIGTVTVNIEGVTPPPEESPVDVILVLDESGSIDGNEYQGVIAAAQAFVEAMDQADGANDNVLSSVRIGVIKYATNTIVRLSLPSSSYGAAYNAVSSRYYPSGWTYTTDALNAARSHLVNSQRPGAATAVVLMTDGYSSQSGGVNAANAIRAIGASVFAVGVGSSVNTSELQQIANTGNYYPVTNFGALTAAFEAIAGEIAFPAATDLIFSADVPAGFTLVPSSASVSKGTIVEGSNAVMWSVARLLGETITLTYQIQHDFNAAPAGGTMTAVDNATLSFTTPKSQVPEQEAYADVTTEVNGCDVTPPEVTFELQGTQGDNDWFITDVQLLWTVTEPETPGTVVTVGCVDQLVTVDGATYSYSCQATSVGGASPTVTAEFKRDATDPTVVFAGNAGTYDIAADVSITCTADDNLSGVASDDCADLVGGAWSFGLGTTMFSATATDFAGNSFSTGGSFTVNASYDGLCSLVQAWVSHQGVANSLCVKLAAAKRADERRNTKARDGSLGAFINEVQAQDDKKVPADKAPLLVLFAQALML